MTACACGHEHDGACINCLCPEWHADVRMVPTLTNGRWELLLPSHRAYRPEWTTPPYWEPERIAAMAEVIGPGDVVYDIGGEEGDMPALWASWGAEVVAVEPNPRVWPNIRAIFEANNLTDRMRGWWVGFAGDESTERFSLSWWQEHVAHEPDLWPSCSYGPIIGNHGFLVLPERPDCPSTTVDLLARQFGPPTVITIDVEGAELTVLRGAHGVLAEQRPAVYVSVHSDLDWMDLRFPADKGDALAAYMQGLGYVGRDLAMDHELHQEWRHPEGR